jgi:hypothetical protein
LLVASPTEVFGANVAEVALCLLAIHCVGRVTLWTSYATAQGQCQSLSISWHVPAFLTTANDAVLAVAKQAMCQPLFLVNKLLVAISRTANAILIHLLYLLDFMLVFFFRQVKQRKQNLQRHYILAPLFGLALNEVYSYFLPQVKRILNWFSYFDLNAVDASLVHAGFRQHDATLLLVLAD